MSVANQTMMDEKEQRHEVGACLRPRAQGKCWPHLFPVIKLSSSGNHYGSIKAPPATGFSHSLTKRMREA